MTTLANAEPSLAPRTARVPAYRSAQRLRGAYYTPSTAAAFMAHWTIRRDGDRVLEPSFGEGIFLEALAAVAQQRQLEAPVRGVELDADAAAAAVAAGLVTYDMIERRDFLSVAPEPVDAVVGNPPYVRLRHLDAQQRATALTVASRGLGRDMDPSGSVWMPFVIHATEFLRPGGRLAYVLPYDLTYVRYARPLWEFLGRSFGSLRVLRTRERLFPEILQDVVILLADEAGKRTRDIQFEAYESLRDLVDGRPCNSTTLPIAGVTAGERSFLAALLPDDLSELLAGPVQRLTMPARDLVTFNIGYVSGDKQFFHPSADVIRQHKLPDAHLVPTVTSARSLKGGGLRTSELPATADASLYLPDPKALTAGDRRYIKHGKAVGVHERYKCQVRDPWYVVPGVRVPDVCVSVFTERPVLLVNDDARVASNSILCGFMKHGTGLDAAARWYTSLTLLQCELEVHALGGGVMVLVPREAGSVRVPRVAGHDHLPAVSQALARDDSAAAYRAGDAGVLRGDLKLSSRQVELVQEGARVLASWRTSARR